MDVLVDSNVLLDIFTRDRAWYDWSAIQVARCLEEHSLYINPLIFAEVSCSMDRIEQTETLLPAHKFHRSPLPWEAAFLAGRCFVAYRKLGGNRRSPMPDFYIGAHALVSGMALLTRDATRYRTYFPKLRLISPPDSKYSTAS
jgi:predicted nucleic acid-binding protein